MSSIVFQNHDEAGLAVAAAGLAYPESGIAARENADGTVTLTADAATIAKLRGADLTDKRPVLAPLIKAATRARILAVLKDQTTQSNINGYILDLVSVTTSGGTLTTEQQADIEIGRSIKTWVGATLSKGRDLIAAGDESYVVDTKWPAPPVGARAFADRF